MDENLRIPIINITGYSGSGKTSFIEKYIPLLKQDGYTPAYIKHSGHFHSFDIPGKDTFRQFHAGAYYSAIFSHDRWAFQSRGNIDLATLQSFTEVDIGVLEGFKNSPGPKVVCVHPERGAPESLGRTSSTPVWAYLTATEKQAREINESLGFEKAFHRDKVKEIADRVYNEATGYYLRKFPLKAAVLEPLSEKEHCEEKLDPALASLLREKLISEVVYVGEKAAAVPGSQNKSKITNQFRGLKTPFGELLTVMKKDPRSAWLLVPANHRSAEEEILRDIIKLRNPLRSASIISSALSSPETAPAIYEPRFFFSISGALFEEQNFSPKLAKLKTQNENN